MTSHGCLDVESNPINLCSRVLLEKVTVPRLVEKFPTFMEPESSLPSSQEATTVPLPEPGQPTPRFPN
jgi:hypothetical protein